MRIFCVVVFLFCSGQLSARSLDDIIDSGRIVVAVYDNYYPFSYRHQASLGSEGGSRNTDITESSDVASSTNSSESTNGSDENSLADMSSDPYRGVPATTGSGIDVDLAAAIAESLGVKLELVWMTAGETTEDDLRNYLWKGHIIHGVKSDLMMRVPYDREYTLKRDDIGLLVHELVHMFAPYHVEAWQVAHDTKNLPEVPTVSLFSYHPVGVEVDSIPQFYLTSAFNGRFREQTKQFDSLQAAFDAMVDEQIHAVMGIRSQVTSLHSTLDNNRYKLAENAFPLIGRQQWDIGLAVHNDYRALAYAVGDIITEKTLNGELQEIFTNYGAAYQMPEYYNY